jgi:acetylornithine deacetylase/succinyl-diaminopimelate desuccinylase-like protein
VRHSDPSCATARVTCQCRPPGSGSIPSGGFMRGRRLTTGTIVAMAAALDALRAVGRAPGVKTKFFFEGEEEAGSPNLERIVRAHRELLSGDVWLICDGPVHQTRRQQLYFGARGVTGVDLTVYGPRRELHSGHYGNWAPNPAMMLARLLGSMKDAVQPQRRFI